MPKVRIPTQLRELSGGTAEVSVEMSTKVLKDWSESGPPLGDHPPRKGGPVSLTLKTLSPPA